MENRERSIYIVVSQTGTMLSRAIKAVTGDAYNHASISLDSSLNKMYSFGRRNPYNPVWGGFVEESPLFGTFKRFYNSDIMVVAVPVEAKKYDELVHYLDKMHEHYSEYHYNYLGLFMALFNREVKMRNSYYCSEFVRDTLIKFDIIKPGDLQGVVKPMQITTVPGGQKIFNGKLSYYTEYTNVTHIRRTGNLAISTN